MNMKLLVSIGIFFSFTLHLFLIIGFLREYPGITDNEIWKWGKLAQSFSNDIDKSNMSPSEYVVCSFL